MFEKMKKEIYVAPEMEQLQVMVESGIAASNTGEFDGEWVSIGG